MKLEVHPFKITVQWNGKAYNMEVTQSYLSDQIEIFLIKGGSKEIQVQSNRPLLRDKGLNKHHIKWRLIESTVHYMSAFELAVKEIESVIRFIEYPPFDWKNHSRNSPH